MVIPRNLTRDHVLQAIERLRREGIPKDAESTKYDLVAPDGTRLPPKAVMELAVEFATGTALPRSGFSGGDQTNRRLEQLEFEIQLKPGVAASAMELDDLRPGSVITNDDLSHIFAIGNAGGMRWSSAKKCLVIVVDHTKALYDDR
jgi:hypothetical protein